MIFILKKILNPFLLPPGIIVIFLMVLGVWLLYKKYTKVGFINFITGILLWILSISPVSDALLQRFEFELKIPVEPQGDVIILLGGGARDKAPDFSGIGAPGGDTMIRIVTAVRLQKRLDVPILVSSGRVYKYLSDEATVIKRFLMDLGVPEEKIILEDRSRDSIENARFARELCEEKGFNKPLIVTSAYHIKRAVFSFNRVGLEVVAVPSGFETWHNKRYGWVDYLPSADELEKTSTVIHEYLGLLFYKIAY